jgi:hypothetical protein
VGAYGVYTHQDWKRGPGPCAYRLRVRRQRDVADPAGPGCPGRPARAGWWPRADRRGGARPARPGEAGGVRPAAACLREPLQTALVLGLLIGAVWVVQGVAGVVDAIANEQGAARGWMIASGVLSVIGGAVVLVYPGASLVVLTWLFGIVLVVVGIVLLAQGLAARHAGTPASAAAPQT